VTQFYWFSDKLRAAVVAQDMIYRKKMGFNSTEPELEHFETPQRKEAIRKMKYLFMVGNRTHTGDSAPLDTFASPHMKALLTKTPHADAKMEAHLEESHTTPVQRRNLRMVATFSTEQME
jgi:hypothetical protein